MWGAFFCFAKAASPLLRVFSSSACAFGAASIGCREGKAQLFIRFDVHAAKAGMNIRGCAPLTTPGGRLRAGRRHALKRGWWDSEKRQKLLQHIKKSPRSVDTERGNGGRPQAVSSGASPAPELPLWSKLKKFLPSVDTERRNGYNTYRVRPKRSASQEKVII